MGLDLLLACSNATTSSFLAQSKYLLEESVRKCKKKNNNNLLLQQRIDSLENYERFFMSRYIFCFVLQVTIFGFRIRMEIQWESTGYKEFI